MTPEPEAGTDARVLGFGPRLRALPRRALRAGHEVRRASAISSLSDSSPGSGTASGTKVPAGAGWATSTCRSAWAAVPA